MTELKLEMVPTQDNYRPPEHLPSNVETVLLQAVQRRMVDLDTAGSLYLEALEAGMTERFPIKSYPEYEGSLYTRFKLTVKNKIISKRIGWWADSLPLEGNDLVPAQVHYSEAKVTELHRFVELVLKELFTLRVLLSDLNTHPT